MSKTVILFRLTAYLLQHNMQGQAKVKLSKIKALSAKVIAKDNTVMFSWLTTT